MDISVVAPFVPPAWWWMWSFPIAHLIHLAEEYWGGEGYLAYLKRLRGVVLSPARYLFFQSIGFILMIVGVISSAQLKWPRFFLVLVAAMTLSNAVTHSLTALSHRGYGPGLISSLLIRIPLGLVTLIVLFIDMTLLRFAIAATIGFAITGIVALIAIRGGRLV